MSIKFHTSNRSEIIRTHISKKRSRRLAARAYFWHSERGSSVVRLVHLPLVLEVPGSIPAHCKENSGVQTAFLCVICRDDTCAGKVTPCGG